MTLDQALLLLSTGTSHERLKAARYLARNARPDHLKLLRAALQNERVSYVRISLEAAIRRISQVYTDEVVRDVDDELISDQARQRIKSEAVEWIAGLLLHEIGSPIGLIARAAHREITDYATSMTKQRIDSVLKTFDAIRQLKGAVSLPKPAEFDLANHLDELLQAEFSDEIRKDVSIQGPRPLIVNTDGNLVRLAVSNGLRNAVEAVAQLQVKPSHALVISYGETDVDYWIAIIDRGVGFVGPSESAFSIGSSTKKGHSGFGLAIARQAVETLSGTVNLTSIAGGGTRFELRWER